MDRESVLAKIGAEKEKLSTKKKKKTGKGRPGNKVNYETLTPGHLF